MVETIIVQNLGGLGNQMFQLAFGISLSRMTGRKLLIDTSIPRDHSAGRHLVNREFDLDIFQLELNEVPLLLRVRFNSHGLSLPWKVTSKLWRSFFIPSIIGEKDFNYNSSLKDLPDKRTVYFNGLWQSYKYFQSHQLEIREAFRFRHKLPESAKSVVHALEESNSVCLHVRRGDYVSVKENAETIGFIGLDYYRRAVTEMVNHSPSHPLFVVFSDDMDWCRSELSWLPVDTVFADYALPELRKKHHVDLQLMARAKRFIIPNSTFSWWAAWLSDASDKMVFAPKRWFKDESIDSSQICPPEWIRI